MKAITIYQPWASLIAIGAKRYETRVRATNYRGPIAIHAGAKHVLDAIEGVSNEALLKIEEAFPDNPELIKLPYGAVIAVAELVECWHLEEHWTPGQNGRDLYLVNSQGDKRSWAQNCLKEIAFGDYTPGRYAWELANVKPLDKPIPAKGRQDLWNWEAP